MSTIPASVVVNVTPNVLSAGGSALDLNGLVLSTSRRVPIGTVASFSNAAQVRAFFGQTAAEAVFAGGGAGMGTGYFGGFEGSNKKPGSLLFAQYNTVDVAAYLRGGSLATMTLGQLQGLSGPLSVTIDGTVKSGSPNLAAATSFSNAAILLATALGLEGIQTAAFTGSIVGTALNVQSVASGVLSVGDIIKGVGVSPSVYITAFTTGTGGPGTYEVSQSQNINITTLTAKEQGVAFNSTSSSFVFRSGTVGNASSIGFASGSLATSLKMTSSGGAVVSPGAIAATPAAFMPALVNTTQNWAAFTTLFDPDVSGFANKLAFSAWTNSTNKRFVYVPWDTDLSPAAALPATGSFGYQLAQSAYNGTALVSQPSDMNHTAFILGSIASIDFDQTDGRTSFKFKRQAGLVAAVSTEIAYRNLVGNGYNCYGAYATANDNFLWLADGTISGEFKWLDSYVNQIWLSNGIQLALVQLLVNARSIPYNSAGYAKIEASLADQINQALRFGAIRAGVTLSSSQISDVNARAGRAIAPILYSRGWYLQILDAPPEVRQARGSPPMTFWYVDGQSVQSINLSSIAVQ